MRVTIDTNDARSFELAEPSPYEFIVERYEPPQKGDNSTYVEVFFEFADPTMQQACGSVRRKFPIDGKGAGFFREYWKAATGEDIPLKSKIDVDLDDAVGHRVMGEITHRTYEGRTYNEISRIVGI